MGSAQCRRQTAVGHPGDRAAVDRGVGEVDEPQPDLLGERGDELALAQRTEVHEHPAQAAAEPALLLDRLRRAARP